VSDTPGSQSYDVECPHCHKTFTATKMTGRAERYQGFKCPHCRLFVRYDRAERELQQQPE
jgi:transposase-like protein